MAWFNFLRKTQTKTDYEISLFPIFSELTPAEINVVQSKVRLVEFKKGETIYNKGEESDGFYLILRGRIVILKSDRQVINHLHAGDHFGETSLLAGRPHSATTEAQNDSILLKIAKKDFLLLLKEIPSLSLNISRTLGSRLTGTLDDRTLSGESKIITFYHSVPGIGNSTFAIHLAAALKRETQKKVIFLDFTSLSDKRNGNQPFKRAKHFQLSDFEVTNTHKIEQAIVKDQANFHVFKLGDERIEKDIEKDLPRLISYFLSHYHFILIDLPVIVNPLVRKAIQQADILYFLIDEDLRGVREVIEKIKEFRLSFGFTEDQFRLILRERKQQPKLQAFYDEYSDETLPIFATLPETELFDQKSFTEQKLEQTDDEQFYSKTMRHLARELAGKLVGLALGSGAAFGYAHVGVLKVLEEEGIKVDMISGSSIGAIIGGMWAAGIPAKQLIEILSTLDRKTTFFKLFGFRDLSAAHKGFFKGDQVVRFLKHYLKGITFRDLKIPTKIIATNLATGAPILFDDGPLVTAIRASISIPGIFRPLAIDNKYLIDGGIAEPLPVQVLNRFGAKKIIAVNVLQSPDDHYRRSVRIEEKNKKLDESMKKRNALIRTFYHERTKFINRQSANIFNVLMKTIQFMEFIMANAAAEQADITLNPVVTDAHWAEFFTHRKFIHRGEEEARRWLDDIKELVNE
ncbi:MAG: hypothetical protein COV74_05465 [Candidatus Omnitrophica bacterium CG11_big_fil_rev_8_21_14_0_20_45_26]|uniref:Cyclic nucleotide-binding domain-containing protein n=1 Tax=Candidatus Abzuiibacterium crystallinum TaxID=1974748 RepID=A0A2H0LRM0_9BACT|nr:MAG: hypothetical protein COV74_05465 [Candidatus Omnitrophica bacterium CG11_big_fil_rev_8_21_14_0_20_45_26]PIW64339.1 MAG: hypothetical protein COW12_06785 [Candidatus Omnitrophica bacterium CG12_big_fil_rev_8_21_14_0_65_45_16]